MHHLLLGDVIRSIEAAPTVSREERADWLTVAGDPRTLTRAAAPAHFTASALPLTPEGSGVCLVLHGRTGLWVQPGGHFEDGDDSVRAAAGREMLEETGLDGVITTEPLGLSRHRAPCGMGEWHLDIQMLAVTSPGVPVVSPESAAVAWFDVDDLPAGRAPGVDALVETAVARLRRSGPRGSPSLPG